MYEASCTIDGRTISAEGNTKQQALDNLDNKLNSMYGMLDETVSQKVRTAAAAATVEKIS